MSLPAAEHSRDRSPRGALWAGLGGVTAAFLGSLCCAGPLLFVTLGVGAGLASTFEPLRPLFGVLMIVLFAAGFYAVYGRRFAVARRATQGGAACAVPPPRRREQIILWVAALLAVVLWTFPTWSLWLI